MPRLLQAVAEQGYSTPTPIQAQAIPAILDGRDVMGGAQTGTGKTAAFALPVLQILNQKGRSKSRCPRCLVLAPTRELAAQVGEFTATYGKNRTLRSTVSVDPAAPERAGHAAATDLALQGAGELIQAALDAALSRGGSR